MEKSFNDIYENDNNLIKIAVDYDDTITLKRPYPERAPLDPKAKKYLDKLHKKNKNFQFILWSARREEHYIDAYWRCVLDFGLDYLIMDGDRFKHGHTGKLLAAFYIDDRSYPKGKVPWRKIYKYLTKKYK